MKGASRLPDMRWLALLAVLAACASEPPPTAELASARAAVGHASTVARQYAPNELAAARAKLKLAEGAFARGDPVRARRLAEEAEVDAQLAQALSQNERSRQ
ncbi:MAG TPA: DUF4398 domain-containing protein [Burkholderiales bacterium]|nr:DUF4398 domain-containing protein [Burkholderiales bacterium]